MEEEQIKQKVKKPLFKKWWFWVIIGVVSIFAIIGIVVYTFYNIVSGADGFFVTLKNDTVETKSPYFWVQNGEYKLIEITTEYRIHNFEKIEKKKKVSEDKYVYYVALNL